jgi:hypothetical protein
LIQSFSLLSLEEPAHRRALSVFRAGDRPRAQARISDMRLRDALKKIPSDVLRVANPTASLRRAMHDAHTSNEASR